MPFIQTFILTEEGIDHIFKDAGAVIMPSFVEIWHNYLTISLPMTNPSIFVNYEEIDTSSIMVLNHTSDDEDEVF